MKHKLLSILLCVLISLAEAILVSAFETSTQGGDILEQVYYEREATFATDAAQIKQSGELNNLYSQVLQAVTTEPLSTNSTSSSSANYMDTYGGAYIDQDKLVICMTTNETLGISNALIEYRIVSKSYNELLTLKASISAKYQELYALYTGTNTLESELLESITCVGINEQTNSVFVDIINNTSEKEELFKSLFNVSQDIAFNETLAPLSDTR